MESKWPGSEGNGGGKFCCFDINLLLGHSDYYKAKNIKSNDTLQRHANCTITNSTLSILSMPGIHACFCGFLDMNAFLGNFVISGKEAHRMQNSDQHEVRDMISNKFSIIGVQKQGYNF